MKTRLLLAAAVAALAVPAAPANAIYCGPIADEACRLVCEVTGHCPR